MLINWFFFGKEKLSFTRKQSQKNLRQVSFMIAQKLYMCSNARMVYGSGFKNSTTLQDIQGELFK